MKAQVAIEFMVLFTIFLAAVIIVLFMVWNNVLSINTATNDIEFRKVLDKIGGKIDTVYLEGDGFQTNVIIPYSVSGMSYPVDFNDGLLWITVQNRTYTRRLLTNNVSGIFKKGMNTLNNVNGVVMIS